VPILAKRAAEIAAGKARGENPGTGPKMVQGFFLDGVKGKGAYIAVKRKAKLPAVVFAYRAQPRSAFGHKAAVGTEGTPELFAFKVFFEPACHASSPQ
jgi:hypothetical protein